MSRSLTCLAPGKVVIIGEYAVIDGAPALVAAVDSGVQCEYESGGLGVRIDAPGDDRFVRAALNEVSAPSGQYCFSAWNPPSTSSKPGLGSSAAATVVAIVTATAPDPGGSPGWTRCGHRS